MSMFIATLVQTFIATDKIGSLQSWLIPVQSGSPLDLVGDNLRHLLESALFKIGNTPITLIFLIKCIIFLALLGVFSHLCRSFLQRRILKYTSLDRGQKDAIGRLCAYLVFLFGLLVGLESTGLDLSSLLVVGGALGIGVGFGLQNVVANFVAGLVLLVERPIRLGDFVEVGNTYGEVVRIAGRCTWVRTNDNQMIIVPNSEFINSRVTNWTANDRKVRFTLPLGVSYGSDPEKVREIFQDIARRHPDVLSDPAPELIFTDFGDSSLNFELRVWTVTKTETPSILKSQLYYLIFAACREHHIEIPFPQRDLHLRSVEAPLVIAKTNQ
jgi:small-conductance mechanosensitive channel